MVGQSIKVENLAPGTVEGLYRITNYERFWKPALQRAHAQCPLSDLEQSDFFWYLEQNKYQRRLEFLGGTSHLNPHATKCVVTLEALINAIVDASERHFSVAGLLYTQNLNLQQEIDILKQVR
jgi:hypothetical protein